MANWTAGDTAALVVWVCTIFLPVIGMHAMYLREKLEALKREKAKLGTILRITRRK